MYLKQKSIDEIKKTLLKDKTWDVDTLLFYLKSKCVCVPAHCNISHSWMWLLGEIVMEHFIPKCVFNENKTNTIK